MATLIFNILLSFFFTSDSSKDLDIDNYLKNNLSEFNRIEYKVIAPKKVDLSSCLIDNSRELKVTGNYAYLPVKVKNGNSTINSSVITLQLQLFKKVMVANRAITRQENLNENYFNIVEKDVSGLRFDPIDSSERLNNYRAKFNISENAVLQESMVEKIPDIRIGDRVEALYLNNSVRISFAVTARTEGVAGEQIVVKNDDKKIFKAKIINNTTVKIIE